MKSPPLGKEEVDGAGGNGDYQGFLLEKERLIMGVRPDSPLPKFA